MNITNKLSIFAENATINNEDYTTTTTGLVYSDDAWKDVDIRSKGESTGIASSRRFNTALRQATFGSKLLGDILVARYADIFHSDISCDNISNVISDIQEIMPPGQQFLRPNDVYTETIQDGAITTNKFSSDAIAPNANNTDFTNSEWITQDVTANNPGWKVEAALKAGTYEIQLLNTTYGIRISLGILTYNNEGIGTGVSRILTTDTSAGQLIGIETYSLSISSNGTLFGRGVAIVYNADKTIHTFSETTFSSQWKVKYRKIR